MNTIENWHAAPSGTENEAVIFVHGIFSSHDTFDAMAGSFHSDRRFRNSSLLYFDYAWGDALEVNRKRLADQLHDFFRDHDVKVTLVCHSMGGLVTRLALLSHSFPNVRRVFLLGTPNFGAISTSQLTAYAQLLLRSVSIVTGTFTRKKGVLDLTKAYEIVSKRLEDAGNATHIDYISIPGCYFHSELPTYRFSTTNAWANLFQAVNVGMSLWQASRPNWAISMARPHDGIVEERSNSLVPAGAGRWSEKSAGICNQTSPRRYVHVQLKECETVTHTDIQKTPDVINLMKDIYDSPDLDKWLMSQRAKGLNVSVQP
jgi:pimeloyl-ACP methyl ester carboxylesterase